MVAQRALNDWPHRREDRGGTTGSGQEGAWEEVHRVRFRRYGEPKVNIIIPTRNGGHLLERCIRASSLGRLRHFEVVVVDNESDDLDTLKFLGALPGRVLRHPHEFSYPRQLNMAAAAVECDLLVFLNNDTEVMTGDWLDSFIEQAMRPKWRRGPRLIEAAQRRHPARRHRRQAWRGHANSSSGASGGAWRPAPRRHRRYGRLYGHPAASTGGGWVRRAPAGGYGVTSACDCTNWLPDVFEPDAESCHAEGSTRELVEDPEDEPLFNDRWRPRSSCDPYYNPNMNRNRLLFRTQP